MAHDVEHVYCARNRDLVVQQVVVLQPHEALVAAVPASRSAKLLSASQPGLSGVILCPY